MDAPSELIIRHRSGSCRVLVQRGISSQAGVLIRETALGGNTGTCAVITDSNVGRLFMEPLLESLASSSLKPIAVEVPAGEGSKSLGMVDKVVDQLAAARLDRHGIVIALGGGVVGDLAGFVAAVYYRGIRHIQLPTTVISQCDSAIGGKTGVNTVRGKNLVGAFHPACLVLVDPEVLRTLPPREFNEGFAEVIKHGIIADPQLFEACTRFHVSGLEELIRRNLEIKAEIVNADEYELNGQRAKLNFGHTIGHGIEQAAGYGRLLHGEAISLGIVAASRISARKAGLSSQETAAIVELLQKFALPTTLPEDISTATILDSLMLDKKFREGTIRFVLVPRIGEARLSDPGEVTITDLEAAVEELRN